MLFLQVIDLKFKELKLFLKNPPGNCKVEVAGTNIREWIVTITGAKDTIYEGKG